MTYCLIPIVLWPIGLIKILISLAGLTGINLNVSDFLMDENYLKNVTFT